MSDLTRLSSGPGWCYQEHRLEVDGPEGYLTLKLLQLLGIQLDTYNILTLGVLTNAAKEGRFEEGEGDRAEWPRDPSNDQLTAL